MESQKLIPLTNDGWGFDSNCFVCEPRNGSGLRIPFFHDADCQVVVAEFTLDERFSGAPRFVHGGVALAILDEAMAWATIAISGQFAVTTETTTAFDRPIKVGMRHAVTARITSVDGRNITAAAHIDRADGKPCARATALFTALDLGQANSAAGAELGADLAAFTVGNDPQV